MNRFTLFLIMAPLAVLAACSSEPTPAAAPTLPTSLPSTSAAPAAVPSGTNSQGRLAKKLGEEAGYTAADGSDRKVVAFSISKITVDPKCTIGHRDAATHTLLLDVKIATGQLDAADAAQLAATMNPFAFQEISKSGETSAAQSSMCTSGKRLPDTWASNSKYTGQIAMDVPEASGTIALVPGGLSAVGGGWEWKY